MADEKLNFNPGDLDQFDRAPDPDDALSAFDSAAGVSVIPPGWYVCKLEAGELVTTSTNKPAYRVRFSVLEPAEHAGFSLWRYFVLHDVANANRAKAALAPLGIRSSADLKRVPFPEADRLITCRVLVAVQKNDPTRNDVERFAVVRDERDASTVAARFLLDPNAATGGGAKS
ncbi:hypothetical protein R5W24_004895 [Gemmata sp. JC717]|uniref:hypothetical protein n=1 Tax=Gemmata algarum TaxID=2975278 RepID=UPI0021BB3BF9|nr:hypothetical protein [Gemmata algarum]MDY3555749.1 hypothetical protein [Gemmata algarum]